MKLYGRKNTLPHTLINLNQLRHYGVIVQDNPACDKPIYIMMEYNYSRIEMHMEGTIVMARTLMPSEQKSELYNQGLSSAPHTLEIPQRVFSDRNEGSVLLIRMAPTQIAII